MQPASLWAYRLAGTQLLDVAKLVSVGRARRFSGRLGFGCRWRGVFRRRLVALQVLLLLALFLHHLLSLLLVFLFYLLLARLIGLLLLSLLMFLLLLFL